MKSIYVSGPMTGIPRFNFPLFDEVTAELRKDGWTVYNPAEHDRQIAPNIEQWPGFAAGDPAGCPAFDRAGSLRWDFATIAERVNAIVMLPRWERSSGACGERYVAEQTGKDIWLAKREWRHYPWSFGADDKKRMIVVVAEIG